MKKQTAIAALCHRGLFQRVSAAMTLPTNKGSLGNGKGTSSFTAIPTAKQTARCSNGAWRNGLFFIAFCVRAKLRKICHATNLTMLTKLKSAH